MHESFGSLRKLDLQTLVKDFLNYRVIKDSAFLALALATPLPLNFY